MTTMPVTGASSGIGLEFARQCLEASWRVIESLGLDDSGELLTERNGG